jgi:hypothetical protein
VGRGKPRGCKGKVRRKPAGLGAEGRWMKFFYNSIVQALVVVVVVVVVVIVVALSFYLWLSSSVL